MIPKLFWVRRVLMDPLQFTNMVHTGSPDPDRVACLCLFSMHLPTVCCLMKQNSDGLHPYPQYVLYVPLLALILHPGSDQWKVKTMCIQTYENNYTSIHIIGRNLFRHGFDIYKQYVIFYTYAFPHCIQTCSQSNRLICLLMLQHLFSWYRLLPLNQSQWQK